MNIGDKMLSEVKRWVENNESPVVEGLVSAKPDTKDWFSLFDPRFNANYQMVLTYDADGNMRLFFQCYEGDGWYVELSPMFYEPFFPEDS